MSIQPYQQTHTVPAAGLWAWTTPDAAAAPVETLAPWLDVQLIERAGGWAHVQCSNGWQCWVDGNALQPLGQPAVLEVYTPARADRPSTPPTNAPRLVAPLAVLAGALVALSTLLPWFSVGGVDSKAFEFPISFLASNDNVGSGDSQINSIGGLVVVIGLVIAALAFFRLGTVRRTAGALAGMVAAVYTLQVFRALNDSPDAPGIFSALGFGVYAAIVGAAIAFVDLGRRRR